MAFDKTTRAIKAAKGLPKPSKKVGQPTFAPSTPIATDMHLPNHSGDHSKGKVYSTPVGDYDIANKKYVDDNLHSAVTVTDTSSVNLTLSGQDIQADVLPAGVDHDSLNNYVANEHIDWTSTSSNLNTSGTATVDGIVLANHITRDGDTNTVIQGTADQWNFVTGASTRFTINNNGVAVSNGDLDMNSNKITELADPTANQEGATKKYVDDNTGTNQTSLGTVTTGTWQATAVDGAYVDIEGTEIKSTGETGGSKFLREDGDGTCSWQTVSGGGSETRRVFYPATALSPEGETQVEGTAMDILNMSSTGSFRLNFFIPPEAASAIKVYVVVVPDATETIQADLTGSHAAAGQLVTQSEQSSANVTKSVTDNTVTEWDVSEVFSGVAASDYCGLNFASDTSNIRALGVIVEYSS